MATSLPLAGFFRQNEAELLSRWQSSLATLDVGYESRAVEPEMRRILAALEIATLEPGQDIQGPSYRSLREVLGDLSRERVHRGSSPTQTASLILALKDPIFDLLIEKGLGDARDGFEAAKLIDQLALFTTEVFQRSREELIVRQQQEIAELSTPVVQLARGILALPLIGTLDSARTPIVMENLLQRIVETEAEIAIIDITGVPTVDTLVAQHLLRTVAAARLMGADCIVSGIRPQIAQTIVHLGVEMNVVSKANLADAFAIALRRTGRAILPLKRVG